MLRLALDLAGSLARSIALTWATLIYAAAPAIACPPGDARPLTLTADHGAIIASGQIIEGNAGQFAVLVATEHPHTIVLDSNGGAVGEAAAMADTIRAAGLSVTVPPRAMCASACFVLLAAGRDRIVAHDSRIGVHRAATNCGLDDSQLGTDVMSSKAIAFGTPSGIVRRMVSTPQPGIAWLSVDELAGMGVRIR
jgi:hypothetical protein